MAFLFFDESDTGSALRWRRRDDRENVVLNWRLLFAIVLNGALWAALIFAAHALF